MRRACHLLTGVLTVFWAVLLVTLSAKEGGRGHVQAGQAAWPSYGADIANSKYSPLDQIHQDNVKELHIACRWSSVENALLQDHSELWTMVNEASPLMIDGRLYTTTTFGG